MRKILIKSEEEYRKFVFGILNTSEDDIWAGYDKELLNIAFDIFDEKNGKNFQSERTEKEHQAIEYYFSVTDNPKHKERVSLISSLKGIDEGHLEEAFGVIKIHNCYEDENGVEVDEEGTPIPDDYSSPEKLVFESWIHALTYPFVIVSYLDSSWDRLGDFSICIVDFVELKDFE